MSLPFSWHGRSSGETVVFGNSLGTLQPSWQHQVQHLSDRYRILTFDLPGHFGDEAQQGAFTFSDIVERTASLLSAEHLHDVYFCGISLSGAVGVALAASNPSLVAGLMVINAPMRSSKEFWLDRAATVDRDGLAVLADGLVERWFASDKARGSDAAFEVAKRFRELPPTGYANACRALATLDVSSQSLAVRAPTMVVSGTADQAVDPVNSKNLAAQIPGATLREVLGGGHMLPLERPQELNAILDGFLP